MLFFNYVLCPLECGCTQSLITRIIIFDIYLLCIQIKYLYDILLHLNRMRMSYVFMHSRVIYLRILEIVPRAIDSSSPFHTFPFFLL